MVYSNCIHHKKGEKVELKVFVYKLIQIFAFDSQFEKNIFKLFNLEGFGITL